jgi:ABC-type dipeptide/oligopeptide/nickel transport system permease subunit
VIDGEPTDVVSEDGVPIGPSWHGSYFLGGDENGRDLMVRLLLSRLRPLLPSML